MQKYKTMADFQGLSNVEAIMASVLTAIPPFFAIILFTVWLFFTGGSFFVILKTTGRKRFPHCLAAVSFACALGSLILVAANTSTIQYLDPYWCGFYIVMTVISYFFVSNYK